jgi:hypothetical protein
MSAGAVTPYDVSEELVAFVLKVAFLNYNEDGVG